jgi:hypothetical protein
VADQVITVPDFKFTGQYYAQILQTLRQWRRVYAPEITSEDDHEPFEQALRAYALASHISNVLCDQVALEHYLRTAKLLSSVRDRLQLIDYQLAQATPAEVEALITLAKVFTTQTMIIGPPSQHMVQFATEQTEVDNEIIFEYLDLADAGLFVQRTDKLGCCVWSERAHPDDPDTLPLIDVTTQANEVGADTFAPWNTPKRNDAIYFGHADVMFDRLDLTINTGSSGVQGVWEYYDDARYSVNPTAVSNNGSTLTLDLTSLLGGLDRTGAVVRACYLPTGAYEEVISKFSNHNYIDLTGIIGQTSAPSTDPQDYSVGCQWSVLPEYVDETSDLQQSGKLTFALPQTLSYHWDQTTVNGFTGYFVRYRIVKVVSATSPVIDAADLSKGDQYLLLVVVQGRTVSDEPLGSSNGTAKQSFKLKQTPLIDDTLIIEVSNVIWTQVDNFLLSRPQDLHFRVWYDDDGYAVVEFGDGINGAVPRMGVNNVAAYYRIGGDQDGNVPVDSLTSNTSGLAYVSAVTNPRPGDGWKINDGGSDADMARLKVAGPASLRTIGRAVNTGDLEALAVAYKAADGSSPVARAYAVEEAYGPKTMEAIVVGAGGNYLLSSQIAEFSTYLNGDRTASPPVHGAILANHQAVVTNYQKRPIDVTATVYGGNETEIKNALMSLLSPMRLKDDGVSYQWDLGGEVPMSVIIEIIHGTSTTVRKVTLLSPTTDVMLRKYELPQPGTISIMIVP